MALTAKQYLDLTGLQAYDALIKNWANSVNQKGYKSILKSADGNKLLLYKEAGVADNTKTADAEVDLGGGDAQAQLNALATVIGATYNSETKTYSLPSLDEDFTATTVVAALNELLAAIDVLNGDNTTVGSVANSIKTAIEALDVNEFAIAEKSENDIITIHGIKEDDGKIAVGSTAANDVTFAKVAATGAAADVTVAAIEGVTGTNAQAALESLKDLIDAAEDAGAISLDVAETATTGYLKTYVLSQGSGDDKQEIGKIDIPKDYLVKSGSVVKNPEGQPEGTYIELVLNVKDGATDESKIYINVAGLVDIYKGAENASEVQITVTDYVISAAVVDIDASKITYIAADATKDPVVARESVKEALARLDAAAADVESKIEEAIKALDSSVAATAKGDDDDQFAVGVLVKVSETDGKLDAVAEGKSESVLVDKAGAATAAYDAIGSIATTDINALFA